MLFFSDSGEPQYWTEITEKILWAVFSSISLLFLIVDKFFEKHRWRSSNLSKVLGFNKVGLGFELFQ